MFSSHLSSSSSLIKARFLFAHFQYLTTFLPLGQHKKSHILSRVSKKKQQTQKIPLKTGTSQIK